MVRTHINLTDTEFATAKAEADRLGLSVPEFLRRSLNGLIRNKENHDTTQQSNSPDSAPSPANTFDRFLGLWTESEANDFDNTVARRVDPDDWS